MHVGYFDIETTDLKGDKGRILCGVIYDNNSKRYDVFRNDDIAECLADDAEIARQIRDRLEDFNIVVGWFSKGFDIPFINTRLVKAGFKPIRPHLHLDPCWYLKGWRGLNPRSSSLRVAAEFFDLKDRKPQVDVDVWIDAAYGGDRKAMDELVDRCKADVKITKEVCEKILATGLVKNIQMYP